MVQPDWTAAEVTLLERSAAVIRQFTEAHADEVFSTFAFTVDSDYAGVALNFDTLEHGLKEAQRAERYQIKHRNQLFAGERGWENARYYVAHQTNRVDDWNRRGSFKYELIAFVELPAWEDYFNGSEECPELEGRIIVSLWRVVDQLVSSGVFEGLRLSSCFRVAFAFHDDEMIPLRILNWPNPAPSAERGAAPDRPRETS
jgi:hypothetical protein